jgi:hypothetical protein
MQNHHIVYNSLSVLLYLFQENDLFFLVNLAFSNEQLIVILSCPLTEVKEGSKNVDESNNSISKLDMTKIFIL